MGKEVRQELFNRSVAGLAGQDFIRSFDISKRGFVGNGCVYRGPNGTKCAIGHLIPDEKYNPLVDSGQYDTKEVCEKAGLPVLHYSDTFYGQLQECHDQGVVPQEMRRYLRDFGIRHCLELPEVLR